MNTTLALEKELEAYLFTHGYKNREQVSVFGQGLTTTYRKEAEGLRFIFTYHWESQGLEPYWWGELSVITQLYAPPPEFLHPMGVLKVADIVPDYLHDLPKMEAYLRALTQVEPETLKQ